MVDGLHRKNYGDYAMEHPTSPLWAKLTAAAKSTLVREKTHGKVHEVFHTADGWAEARGATHTLYCGEGHGRGIRAAKLGKTVLWVSVDEVPTADGTDHLIVWEKWDIKHL
jgi:hypothetical protein